MTTNAVYIDDCAATDSRWTMEGSHLHFDDTGFEKIEIFNSVGFVFAGGAKAIDFLKFVFSTARSLEEINENNLAIINDERFLIDVAWCAADFKAGEITSSCHIDALIGDDEKSYFVGTGGCYAQACWLENRSILRSVGTAIYNDPGSGGQVKFINKSLGKNIADYDVNGIQKLYRAIEAKESVMNGQIGNTTSIKDKLSSGVDIDVILDELKEEKIVAQFDGRGAQMSDSQKDSAVNSLKKAFSWVRRNSV
jgi:hypothetical protein